MFECKNNYAILSQFFATKSFSRRDVTISLIL